MNQIFYEIHRDLPRQGPGCNESTGQAFGMLSGLPEEPQVLDIGCGTGIQSIELARISGGTVTAFDNHQPFLDKLEKNADIAGVADRIKIVNGTMFDLPFEDSAFDIIWAEGSLYIMGFERGLRKVKRLLRPGGWVAASEISWLKFIPPKKPLDFWRQAYPAMKTVEENAAVITSNGYTLAGHFTLPVQAWWDDYYTPLEKQLAIFSALCARKQDVMALINEEKAEINLYREYSDWYGYEFYVMRKPE